MTRRPDQAGDARFEVPEEFADLADRVSRCLQAQTLDPAVRARHIHRLRELAAAQPVPKPQAARAPRVFRWRGLGRRVAGTAAAGLAVVMLSTSAVAAASQTALPGDPLYPTKRFVERVQLAAAMTPEGDVAVLMDQAQRRALEAIALRERGADPALVDQALLDLQRQLQQAQLASLGDQQLQQQLAVAAVVVMERLQVLGNQMPESEEDSGAYKAAVHQAAAASSRPEPAPAADQPAAAGGGGESAGPSNPDASDQGAFDGAGPASGTTSTSDPADGGPPGPGDGTQPGEPAAAPDPAPPEPEPVPQQPPDDPATEPSDDPSGPSDYQSQPPPESEDPGASETPSEAAYHGETVTATPTTEPVYTNAPPSEEPSPEDETEYEYGGVPLAPHPY